MSTTLMLCSTTPRTTMRLIQEAIESEQRMERNHVIYDEAKLALGSGEFKTARTLLELLPPSYRNAGRYLKQCELYDELCSKGVLQRPQTEEIRTILEGILKESKTDVQIVRYADKLLEHGYNAASLSAVDLFSVGNVLSTAEMSHGHAHLICLWAERNTPWEAKLWMRLLNAFERCAPVAQCLGGMGKRPEQVECGKKKKALKQVEDVDEEDDEDETAGDDEI